MIHNNGFDQGDRNRFREALRELLLEAESTLKTLIAEIKPEYWL